MLTYFEAARYKIGNALSEIEGGQRGKHPLAEYILVSRDKQGLQQSVLKVTKKLKTKIIFKNHHLKLKITIINHDLTLFVSGIKIE